MIVTFVHHSCFTVELPKHFLVFDYFDKDHVEGYRFTGVLPPFPENKKVFVFASHSHKDHFDMEVLKWAVDGSDIHYFLSKDIRLGNNYLERNHIPFEIKNQITFVKPLEKYTLGEIEVKTLRSTDAGVAFIVTVEGKTLYHAGDLNLWKWDGVGDLVNSKEARDFKREIIRLEKTHIDVAFVPFDSRQKQYAKEGMDYFMKTVEADVIFPMHMWQNYDMVLKYKASISNRLFADRLVEISGENEAYEL